MSTTIGSNGNASLNSKGGRLNFEHDKNRIIGRDTNNKPNLIITADPLFEIAQDGYDVTDCTDDQKVMSSKFNMYKIIASGDVVSDARNLTVTLTTTNIGYRLDTYVDTGIGSSYSLSGHIMINVNDSFGTPIKSSGYAYNDGTNVVIYKKSFMIDPATGYLRITQAMRLLSGTFSFNPYDSSYINRVMKWDICNQTIISKPGGGSTGSTVSKYCFFDKVVYDKDGNNTVALESSTYQFFDGEWQIFPDQIYIR